METLNCRHSLEADSRKVNCEYVLRLFRGRHTDSHFCLLPIYEKPELPFQLAAPVNFYFPMVEISGITSSNASSRILAVSREVNIFTPFCTAQRRMATPSS